MKTSYLGLIFEKYYNIKFHENPSNGSPAILYKRTGRRTDSHDKRNSRRLEFLEGAVK